MKSKRTKGEKVEIFFCVYVVGREGAPLGRASFFEFGHLQGQVITNFARSWHSKRFARFPREQ